MAILGLLSAESISSERFNDIRRGVFYFYPNGASPLMGLLSLMKDEVTNDPEFKIYEKRLQSQRSVTAAISGNVVLYKTVSADFGTYTAADGDLAITADSVFGVKVAATTEFRVNHLIKFPVIVSGVADDVIGRVVHVDSSNSRLAFVSIKNPGTATYNSASGVGVEVLVVGNASFEGDTLGGMSVYNLPINPSNYTQIYRTPFELTGTALKTSAKYDESGPYKDLAKEASVLHMIELEKNFIFGEKRAVTSGTKPIRYTGGVLWYLRSWEAANSIYRGGSGASAITANTSDDKRIINFSDGYITHKLYSNYLERCFRVTNNKANEKLVLCGSGFLNVINQLYEGRAVLNASLPMTETFGMSVVAHETPFGKIYYKSHPLFSQNPILRYNALFLDVNNFVYRYLDGRDTDLLTERQDNDADYRIDEYLTEAGLEVRFPESNMYLTNVLDWK